MTRVARRPEERFVRLAAEVRAEIDRLSLVVGEAEGALKRFAARSPSTLELRGIGDVLHDFYTGTERIFMKIAPELNGGVPAGLSWHRELLHSMTLALPGIRPPLLRLQTARGLEEYLRFRHVFRNLYGFELEWDRLRPLLRRVKRVWSPLRGDLSRFLRFLEAAASSKEGNEGVGRRKG